MVANNAFIEWANVHNKRYGTSKKGIQERLANGDDVLLEIDYQGALQVRDAFPQAVLIFIRPPSWEELRSRLENRGEDAPEVIELRMNTASNEVAKAKEFDFVITNELFASEMFELNTIIHAHRLIYTSPRRLRSDVCTSLLLPV